MNGHPRRPGPFADGGAARRPGRDARRGITWALTLLLVGCGGEGAPAEDGGGTDAGPSRVQALELSAEPAVEIGVLAGDEDYQFDEIVSVLRLPSGRIAVADAGQIRVSLFEDDGTLVRHFGSRGEGPGEFRGLGRIYVHGPDSLLAVDAWGGRVSAFSTAGDFGRQIDPVSLSGDSVFRLDVWLYGPFWVEGALQPQERRRVRGILDRVPTPPRAGDDPGYRLVRVDAGGSLWIREPGTTPSGTRRWTRIDAEGRPDAALETPARFAPMHVRDHEILGRWRGENDVNFVRVYGLRRGDGAAEAPAWLTAPPAPPASGETIPEDELMAYIRSGVKQMASAQEIHYSQSFSYTTEIDSLAWEPEEGVAADVIEAHNRGWAGVFVHPAVERICGLGYGSAVPAGWIPGSVLCSDPREGEGAAASPASARGG